MKTNQEIIEKKNLTAISWAHAVNSKDLLDEALNCEKIDMIEADIVLGKIDEDGDADDIPIMAHPPANVSDISLVEFLETIISYNEMHKEKMKGVKLDFKSIEVFEGSQSILNEMIPSLNFPVWLNADIVSGPVEQITTMPVDPDRFLAGCAGFDETVLSIGWTTRWGADYKEGSYTDEQIYEMIHLIKCNNDSTTGHPITFPVRAGIAANSLEQLHNLVSAVNDTNDCTLTIWSSENDYVDVKKLRELIFSFGLDRVYLDVPTSLSEKLDLGRGNSAKDFTKPTLLNFSIISAVMVAASIWLGRTNL